MRQKAGKSAPWLGLRKIVILSLVMVLGEFTSHTENSKASRTIVVHARKYAFVPNAVTLKKGETVKITLISDDVHHSLAVRGLGIRFDAKPDHPGDLILTPDAVGDFPGTCAFFCGSGHRDMAFTIHVVE